MSDAPQIHTKKVSATRNIAISYLDILESGELLTGTPTVTTGDSPESLTIDNAQVNTTTLTINGESCVAGQAVQFRVAGGTANTTYPIYITCSTDATPAQTIGPKRIDLIVESDT